MMDLAARKELAGSLRGREVRRVPASGLELREVNGALNLSGWASVTDRAYDMGYYTETVQRGAFTKTLSETPDVQLLLNHEGLPLARTLSGTLRLEEDERGLAVDADLDPNDPDVQRLAPKVQRGDIDQMSFAFRATRQEWDDDYENRTIIEVNIDRGDVSVVNQGANPATAFSLRDAHQMLSALPRDEFREFMESIRADDKLTAGWMSPNQFRYLEGMGHDQALLALRAGTASPDQINMLASLVCNAIDMADDAFDAFLSALGIPDPDASEDAAEADRSLDLYKARAFALRLRAA